MQRSSHVNTSEMKMADMETHIFASHGLKHLLQLNSELLDVIDYDTWLRGEGEKSLHTLLSHSPSLSIPVLCLLPAFYCNQSRLALSTFFYCPVCESTLGDAG